MLDEREAWIEQEVLALVQDSERTLLFFLDHVRATMFEVDLATLGRVVFRLVDLHQLEALMKVCSRNEDRHALLYTHGWSEVPDIIQDGEVSFEVRPGDLEVVFRKSTPGG